MTDTFAGIAPVSAPAFVLAQLVGGALGFLLIRLLYPSVARTASVQAEQKVIS
jgi:arsenate reductase